MPSTHDLIRRARELAKLREKATPGPWKKTNLSFVRSQVDMSPVASTYTDEQANAKLIAVAPEMAALLERLVETLQDELSEYGQHKPTCPRASASGDAYFRVACTCGFDELREMNSAPEDANAED